MLLAGLVENLNVKICKAQNTATQVFASTLPRVSSFGFYDTLSPNG